MFVFSLNFSCLNQFFKVAASIGGDTVLENLEPTVHVIVFGQKLFRFQSDNWCPGFVVLLLHQGVKAFMCRSGKGKECILMFIELFSAV